MPAIYQRIGIHSGKALVGNVGCSSRIEVSIIHNSHFLIFTFTFMRRISLMASYMLNFSTLPLEIMSICMMMPSHHARSFPYAMIEIRSTKIETRFDTHPLVLYCAFLI
jgi:hypothetical protein